MATKGPLSQPEQIVLPGRITPGTARLLGPTDKLRIGVHRLVVNITFQSGSGTKPTG